MEFVQDAAMFRHFQIMSNELNTPKLLYCPSESDRGRTMATVFSSDAKDRSGREVVFSSNSNLSYFVGVDAVRLNPRHAFNRRPQHHEWDSNRKRTSHADHKSPLGLDKRHAQ